MYFMSSLWQWVSLLLAMWTGLKQNGENVDVQLGSPNPFWDHRRDFIITTNQVPPATSVCLFAINSRSTVRIFMQFSPIGRVILEVDLSTYITC